MAQRRVDGALFRHITDILGLQIFKTTGNEKRSRKQKDVAPVRKRGESAENCKRDNMLEKLSSPYPWTHKNGASLSEASNVIPPTIVDPCGLLDIQANFEKLSPPRESALSQRLAQALDSEDWR
jgi:hypothetical protein